ncbi:putative T6SS immunity periplasmic lipoprotein [Pseudomonas cerasi]
MKLQRMLIYALLSSLLTGCWLSGDYTPHYEIVQVSRTGAGFCFHVENPGDYYTHFLSIRDRNAPERSGFNRDFPALIIDNNQICIPEKYYKFPDNGEVNVDIALRSPTKRMIRRFVMSEFKIVNGVPYPFNPREYSIPIPDAEDYQ